jgi:4-hydroxy-tetrahydrodipicolinate synthase
VHGCCRCTARWVALIECGLAGKIDEGRHHHDALLPVVQTAFAEPNPAVFKGVLHAQGRIASPDVRMPLSNASAAAVDRCLAAIEHASS